MTHNQKGMFIALEGVGAAGKTTHLPYVQQLLEEKGLEVVVSREPGGTKIGEALRELVLNNRMHARTEAIVFAAARAEHVETHIKPEIERGKIVLSDRYVLSSLAYQGYGRELGDFVHDLAFLTLGDFLPNHTLFFNTTLEEWTRRVAARTNDHRFNTAEIDFRQRVWTGFQELVAVRALPSTQVIDTMGTMDATRIQLRDWVDKVFYPDYLRHQRGASRWDRLY